MSSVWWHFIADDLNITEKASFIYMLITKRETVYYNAYIAYTAPQGRLTLSQKKIFLWDGKVIIKEKQVICIILSIWFIFA